MTETSPAAAPALKRVVSRWQIVGLSINDVVGSGVYLLAAEAAALLGGWSVGAVAVAGVAVLLVVLCFAEAASRFDQPGSAYLYAKTAFGTLVGFEVGWMTWLARVASIASLSAGFAQALTTLWPAVEGGAARTAAIVLPLLGLTAINVIGVRAGVHTAVVLVLLKVVPLLVFVVVGLPAVSLALVGDQSSSGGLAEAALLLLFAYAGFENTPAAAGEFRNPKRDVPFALLVQIGLVTALYVAVQFVALGTLANAGASKTPLADAARVFLGAPGALLLGAGAVFSILGTNNNTVLAGPRYLFALARDGFGGKVVARWLAAIHPRFGTPSNAILLQTAVALPLALSGSFAQLAMLSVMARLATYLGTAAAVPVLRRKLAQAPATFVLPGGALIPAAAVAITLVLALSASKYNLIAAALALAAGWVLYLLRDRERSHRATS